MKYEGFEGTPEEFDNFTKTEGFPTSEFFKTLKPGIHIGWIIAPSLIFIACILINIFLKATPEIKAAASIIGLCSGFWIAISSHITWKLKTVTGLIPVMAIIALLFSTSEISMAEALEKVETLAEECPKKS